MARGISIRLPVELMGQLREISKENCRTVQQTIAWMLKQCYEEINVPEEESEQKPKTTILKRFLHPGSDR